ncbi:MAG: division/cell wall cluster transcriptional repressor MraZ [Lachnospiraceae bacterium]|nr:division/cell wall cluster transcriptional repressor MraZ [Lachnospiraceae bacterium]
MGFMTEYQNNMDAKGRVILPIKFRETIGNKFILTKGFDHNLFIYPLDEWKNVEEKLSKLKITSKNSRIIKRLLQGSAVEVEIDNQDRITIPQNLRLYAELEKEILFVGQGEYIEIWAKSKFDEANECDVSDVAEEIDF